MIKKSSFKEGEMLVRQRHSIWRKVGPKLSGLSIESVGLFEMVNDAKFALYLETLIDALGEVSDSMSCEFGENLCMLESSKSS